MGLMSVSTADRFMRGRSVLDPSLIVMGKAPLQTHVSPEDSADGVAGIHGAEFPEAAGLKVRCISVLIPLLCLLAV